MEDRLENHKPPAESRAEGTGDFDGRQSGEPVETGVVQDRGGGPDCLLTNEGPEGKEGHWPRPPLARFCGSCQRYVIAFANPDDLKYKVTDQEGRAVAFRIEHWNAWTESGHPDVGSE